jgi:hypothetical protein
MYKQAIQNDLYNEIHDYFRLMAKRVKSLEFLHEQSASVVIKLQDLLQT